MNTTQLLFSGAIEIILMLITAVFLFRPATTFRWIGMFFLCITFCWSVILGFVLYINGIEIQF